jgi:hypothetical protein
LVCSEVSAGGAGTWISVLEVSTQVFHCPTVGPLLTTSLWAGSAVAPRSASVITKNLIMDHFNVNMIILSSLSS